MYIFVVLVSYVNSVLLYIYVYMYVNVSWCNLGSLGQPQLRREFTLVRLTPRHGYQGRAVTRVTTVNVLQKPLKLQVTELSCSGSFL